MPTAPDECPFCAIVRREDPDVREIFRDEDTVCFFPTEPATLGHMLIVPRSHVEDIYALDEATAIALNRTVLRVAAGLRQALAPDGLNVIQSNGEVATQTVHHLHVHLVPRWPNDGMGPIWPEVTNFPEESKNHTADLLRAELSIL